MDKIVIDKSKEIKVKCTKCGKPAFANQFAYDPEVGRMVCQNCIKSRKEQAVVLEKQKVKQEETKIRPTGWDQEDDYLEKVYAQKQKANAFFERIDDDRVNYTCPSCRHKFVYNTAHRRPNLCPFCGSAIMQPK